jgi:hypothetical protein
MGRRSDKGGRLGAALLALLLMAGCAGRRGGLGGPREAMTVDTPVGRFSLEYVAGQKEEALMVLRALENASPKLARWGTLEEPVTVRVHADHDSLEDAARRSGYAWLRAWARYDEVDVQAPGTWGLFGATQRQVDEVLLHELTHSLMYQLASDRLGWRRAGIPPWFREGMASYTSEQGYHWPSLEQLTRYLHANPAQDPLKSPEELYRKESAVVYGAAHHAFNFLVKRYGEDAVRALMREMDRGVPFPEAFGAAVGLPLASFERDFDRYVRLRGYKGGRILKRQTSPQAPATE